MCQIPQRTELTYGGYGFWLRQPLFECYLNQQWYRTVSESTEWLDPLIGILRSYVPPPLYEWFQLGRTPALLPSFRLSTVPTSLRGIGCQIGAISAWLHPRWDTWNPTTSLDIQLREFFPCFVTLESTKMTRLPHRGTLAPLPPTSNQQQLEHLRNQFTTRYEVVTARCVQMNATPIASAGTEHVSAHLNVTRNIEIGYDTICHSLLIETLMYNHDNGRDPNAPVRHDPKVSTYDLIDS
jgi:hypothetical protein